MAQIPNDLTMDILTRLPMNSLLRFKCVSKEWCDLIKSKDFVKQHLNHSILTKTNSQKLILHSPSEPYGLYSVGLNSLDQALKLAPPNNCPSPVTKLIGSCNGLICLVHMPFDDTIILWNMGTRKHIKVPFPVIKSPLLQPRGINRLVKVHGFGYDSVSDDYKVVMLVDWTIVSDNYFHLKNEAHIYSLKSNSWRKTLDYPVYNLNMAEVSGALACGALHWIVSKFDVQSAHYSSFILAFDLVNDEFRIVKPPHLDEIPTVSELRGCLSIAYNYFKKSVLDVWVMKDYGVKESWTLLFTLSGSEIMRSFNFVIPLAYLESQDEVLMVVNSEEVLWYNIGRRTARFLDLRGLPTDFGRGICLHSESLISLGEREENDEIQVERKRKRRGKTRMETERRGSSTNHVFFWD